VLKDSFGALECTRVDLESWWCRRSHLVHWRRLGKAQGVGRVEVEHIKAFGPCKCSIIVDVFIFSSKVLI